MLSAVSRLGADDGMTIEDGIEEILFLFDWLGVERDRDEDTRLLDAGRLIGLKGAVGGLAGLGLFWLEAPLGCVKLFCLAL